MKITTSKGKEYEAAWAFGPLRGTSQMMMEIVDNRKLSVIAAEFEDCEAIKTRTGTNENEPAQLYEGYTKLISVTPGADAGTVRLTLEQPKE